MAYIIYDLDGTVIDSTHRQLTDANGSLDLAHWREHCTPAMIAQDKLLPLAPIMREHYSSGNVIIVCTARICTPADMEYLENHNLRFHYFISRDVNDMRPDAEYKRERLTELAHSLGFDSLAAMRPIMFDDNLSVIAELMKNGVDMRNAESYNRAIKQGHSVSLERKAA